MGRPILNLVGLTFGELTVRHPVPFTGKGARWYCECSCGKRNIVAATNLRSGKARSCGHLLTAPKSTLSLEERKRQASLRATRWNKEHKERRRVVVREWRQNNPSKHSANSARYRARKISQVCRCCSPQDFSLVYLLASLGDPALTVDHIIPLSKGGSHCVSNMQLLTFSENASKGARVTGGY